MHVLRWLWKVVLNFARKISLYPEKGHIPFSFPKVNDRVTIIGNSENNRKLYSSIIIILLYLFFNEKDNLANDINE